MVRSMTKVALVTGIWMFAVLQTLAQAPAAPQSMTRDSAAVQLLITALNQAGGMAAWQSVHGAKVTGTLTAQVMGPSGTKTVTNNIIWVDDWSTGHHRYSRTETNGKGGSRVLRHGDKQGFAAQAGGKSITLRFDSASILLTHLPAASLARVLSDTSYSIMANEIAKDPDHDEVLVTKRSSGAAQIWYVSKKTGQIDAVKYAVPDALNAFHHPSEIALYKHYRTDSGRIVPDEVDIIRPNSATTKFHFDSLEVNPKVPATEFTLGGAQ